MRVFGFQRSTVRRSLCALAAVLVAGTLHAQNITVTAANSSNDAIYNVTFSGSGGSINVLNTDAGSLHHLVSLAFYPNLVTFSLDLLAADNQGGTIVCYPGDFHAGPGSGNVVYASNGSGLEYPDALSADTYGNLYAVNAKPGNTSLPALYFIPSNPAGSSCNPQPSGFGTPQQLDNQFASTAVLLETMVVGRTIYSVATGNPVVNPGDLLVLTGNPASVLRYPGGGGAGPVSVPQQKVLLDLSSLADTPGGMAFWPPDGTLLVTTSRGTIYQLDLTSCTSTVPCNPSRTTFASGLGNGQFKVKAGVQFGNPYAYVANNNGGDILQFAGPNNLTATVTSGVQHPQGLAVTNINYAALAACQNGCDLLGDTNHKVLIHDVPANLPGNILENVCIVPVDPRLVQPNSSCTTDLTAAQVSSLCGGYSVAIPKFLCGSSGPTHKGFALVKTLTQAYAMQNQMNPFPFNGSLIFNDSDLSNILNDPQNPVCNPPAPQGTPLGTLTWAPLAGEGTVVEGNNMLEITSGCDGGTSKSYGLSLFGIGLGLNISAIPGGLSGPMGYVDTKYKNVLATISGEVASVVPNSNPSTTVLPAQITPAFQAPDGNFTYQLQQCIATSRAAFATSPSDYAGAALEALAADSQIAAAAALSPQYNPFTPDADYPNPSGALRSRLENIYYTINTRIQGNHAAASVPTPPLAPPSPTISGTPASGPFKAGTFYTFITPTAMDFAGNKGTLSYSITGKPLWANFDTTTGILSGLAVKGNYSNIVITVTDGCASKSLAPFSIKVVG